jgi:maleate isomerase
MIAPYPDDLIAAGRAYWESRDIAIASLERLHTASSDTRTIYDLRASDAEAALARVDTTQVDAVLLSGTGLATLPLVAAWKGAVPLLSSNLCLAARLLSLCGQEAAINPATLLPLGFEARLAEARGGRA